MSRSAGIRRSPGVDLEVEAVRSSPCSDRAEAASRRSSGRSPASSGSTAARSRSTAVPSRVCRRIGARSASCSRTTPCSRTATSTRTSPSACGCKVSAARSGRPGGRAARARRARRPRQSGRRTSLSGGERKRVALARALAPAATRASARRAARRARPITPRPTRPRVGRAVPHDRADGRLRHTRRGRGLRARNTGRRDACGCDRPDRHPRIALGRTGDAWVARFIGLQNVVERGATSLVTRPEGVVLRPDPNGDAVVVSSNSGRIGRDAPRPLRRRPRDRLGARRALATASRHPRHGRDRRRAVIEIPTG